MAVKLDDGLVHATYRHENDNHYGKTTCDVTYTNDPVHIEIIESEGIEGTLIAKMAKPPITCLMCIARSTT